eukprot:24335_3
MPIYFQPLHYGVFYIHIVAQFVYGHLSPVELHVNRLTFLFRNSKQELLYLVHPLTSFFLHYIHLMHLVLFSTVVLTHR